MKKIIKEKILYWFVIIGITCKLNITIGLLGCRVQLVREARKIQDFNGVWTRDLAILVRCSNQLSYEATDVGSWSFVD